MAGKIQPGEARSLLQQHNISVDPSDHRSDLEILRALGHLPGEIELGVAGQQSEIPALDYGPGTPSLRPASSRRLNMF